MSCSPSSSARASRTSFLAIACALIAFAPMPQAAGQAGQTPPSPAPTPVPERILPPIRYSLPPSGEQSAPPTLVPAEPQPVPTPTARAIQIPVPAPTRRADRPAANAPAEATPQTAPSRSPVPDTGPARPLPPIDAPALPPPAVAVAPSPTPSSSASPVASDDGIDWTWWMLAGGGLLIASAGLYTWRRRQRDAAAEPTAAETFVAPDLAPTPPVRRPVPAAKSEPQPAPAASAPVPATEPPRFLSPRAATPVAPDGTIRAFRDRPAATPAPAPVAAAVPGTVTAFRRPGTAAPVLGVEMQPIRAGCTDDAGFVEFTFAIVNGSDIGVSDMMVSAWLMSANREQDAQIAAYLAEPLDPAQHNRHALGPGQHKPLGATMHAPFDLLHIVEAGGRRFFAPMLLVDARYRAATGAPGRTAAAFVIGRPQATSGKLAPIFIDRGPRIVDGLAARPYRIATES